MKMLAILIYVTVSFTEIESTAVDVDTLSLENQVLELQIHRFPTPHVSRLVHKQTGKAVVSDPQDRDLFQIVFGDDDKQKTRVEGSVA
mgnify:CR=1 FL=1